MRKLVALLISRLSVPKAAIGAMRARQSESSRAQHRQNVGENALCQTPFMFFVPVIFCSLDAVSNFGDRREWRSNKGDWNRLEHARSKGLSPERGVRSPQPRA